MSAAVSQLPTPLSIALSGSCVRSVVLVRRDGHGPARQRGVDSVPQEVEETRRRVRRSGSAFGGETGLLPWRAGTSAGSRWSERAERSPAERGRRERGRGDAEGDVDTGLRRSVGRARYRPPRNPVGTWAKDPEGDARDVRCHDSGERIGLNAGACERKTRRTRVRSQEPGTSVGNGGKGNPASRCSLASSVSGRLVLHRQPRDDRERKAVPENLVGRRDCRLVRRGWAGLCCRRNLPTSGVQLGTGSRGPRARRLSRLSLSRIRVRCCRSMYRDSVRTGAEVRKTEGVRDTRDSGSRLRLVGQRRTVSPMGPSRVAADRTRLE